MTTSSISPIKKLGRVACFILVVALSLYLFIPFSTKGPDLTAYTGSDYYPIITKISDYRYQPSPYKNNFQYISSVISGLFGLLGKGGIMAPEDGGDNMAGSPDKGNGEYVESTDNQVDGVIEADLVKRTDKYIFRLAPNYLKIYDINGEDTTCITSFEIPGFADERSDRYYEREMYLSADASTVTVLSPYYDLNYNMSMRIISIDVSDLDDIKITKTISIDGNYNSSRMVDGKLLLITEYYAKSGDIDYADPSTFVPSITEDGESSVIKFEDIIYPEELASTRYSVVALIDEGSLDLIKAYALLDFHQDIYVSNDNVYVVKEYQTNVDIDDNGSFKSTDTSDIVVLGYSDDTLENKGILTVDGFVDDQYSMDEYEGYFRVVTSTREQTVAARKPGIRNENLLVPDGKPIDSTVSNGIKRSANLTVFNLETLEKTAEVIGFAPDGENVSSVRFDGNTAYVCTAIVQTFTDPVFFFDLSDYSNITYTDTGVIDGFSTSLIQLGDGFLLGIGEENWQYSKVEVYEERGGAVESVAKYTYTGSYSLNYKAYYVNREYDLFGFAVHGLYDEHPEYGYYYDYYDAYVLLHFNGYELVEVAKIRMDINNADRIRSFVEDGYLYIIDDYSIEVVNIGTFG